MDSARIDEMFDALLRELRVEGLDREMERIEREGQLMSELIALDLPNSLFWDLERAVRGEAAMQHVREIYEGLVG
jgi:hypothetical protein